ncbi:Origin recognition complex subunit 5 [Blomia tropicalis]|nr:Origin recognition complex subunit 5 [Blomia tropicalis]
MDIESKLATIDSKYRFRNVQTRQLFHYLNLADTNNIVAYGPRATCKTGVVRSLVFEQLETFHVWINVLHHVNVKSIYESILLQIQKHLDIEENDPIHYLQKFKSSNNDQTRLYMNKFIVVLDNVDSLFRDNCNVEFIYLMNYLEQLTKNIVPISVIYISGHSIEWLMRQCDFKPSSLQVVFNEYTYDEMLKLLSSYADIKYQNYTPEFFNNYVNIILKTFHSFTRNFAELRNISLSNFQHYIKPITVEELTENDQGKLYMRFQPRLQDLIENFIADHKCHRVNISSFKMSPSMNYLLVSSYLATYNPIRSDKKHFVRNQGRVRKIRRKHTLKMRNDDEDSTKQLKPFTFERVFNIYQALLHLNENNRPIRQQLMSSGIVFEQFHELIKQNLIHPIKSSNTSSISSHSKYLISDIVTHKHIDDISFSIGLDFQAFVQVD